MKVLYNLFFFLFLGEKRDFPQFSPNNLFTKFFDNVILPSGLCAAFFLAFLRRASPKQRAGASFPIPLSCRSLGCEGKKRRCIQIPIPLFARLPSSPISVARHKEKNLFRFSSGADPALQKRRRAYSFYKKSFAIYNCITVPKMSSSAVRTVSALCFYNVIIKLPFL